MPLPRLILLAGLLALGACAAPERVGLGETEVRRPVEVAEAPWRSIGVVATSAGGRCTGAVVGPRHVLTAAHCLLEPRNATPVPPEGVIFVLGIAPGQRGMPARVASIQVGPGFAALPGPRPDPNVPADADWALLTLDPTTPALPPDRVLALAPASVPPGVRLAYGGYQADAPDRLVADLDCTVLGYGRDPAGRVLLRHSCAATGGASGGPLLVRMPDGAWMIAAVGSIATVGAQGGWAVPAVAVRRAGGAVKPGA